MRVVFLGNHTVGVAALSSLLEVAEVVGVVAHPTDPEDGARYESVFDFARTRGLPVMRGRGRGVDTERFIRDAAPDVLWITDYRYLLPPRILDLAPRGAINLHPSLLPAYRGRAPLNWAILRGETSVGLTAHMVDEGMDSGPILAQRRIALTGEDDVGDVLARLMPLYADLPREIIPALAARTLTAVPQNHHLASEFPARTPADGRIDWTQPAQTVHNLVRAVAAPYPGAFSQLGARTVTVWRARPDRRDDAAPPGTILSVDAGIPTVQCGEGSLTLLRTDGAETPWTCGARFA